MTEIQWGDDPSLFVTITEGAPVAVRLGPAPSHYLEGAVQPLVEVLATGYGRAVTSMRGCRTAIGTRFRPISHSLTDTQLVVIQTDEETGLQACTNLTRIGSAIRATTTLTNTSDLPYRIESVTSLALGGFSLHCGNPAELELWTGRNECFAENQWGSEPLWGPAGLSNTNSQLHKQPARGSIARTGSSTWSTGLHQPMGLLTGPAGSLAWQIETSGPWHWELVSMYDPNDCLGLLLHGPTDRQHSWSHLLRPGHSFESEPVSFVTGEAGVEDAIGKLTNYRRVVNRGNRPGQSRPLIYNDYMNTLMGDPSSSKLIPLIDAAASVGAVYFCIDAGWYDDGKDWWPSVGQWLPSKTRFEPEGLSGILRQIRQAGMRPGLWLEPEVVGVLSPIAQSLPEEAFMSRGGTRIMEHDRYFLDLRSPIARQHIESTIDRLVIQYGIEYIKWDYNVNPGTGPDSGADSPGDGLLDHVRALMNLLGQLRDHHPSLVIEACSSGGQRQDPAVLSRFDLQSTSDQQDLLLYPPIAAGAPMAIPPEQAGNWAYPQPDHTAEEMAFTLVTGLAGRMYLSGRLDQMNPNQLDLIRMATNVYPTVIEHHSQAVPSWPLGLPQWPDEAVALLTLSETKGLLFVWARDTDTIRMPLPQWAGQELVFETLYPTDHVTPWTIDWHYDELHIEVSGDEAAARVIQLHSSTGAPITPASARPS